MGCDPPFPNRWFQKYYCRWFISHYDATEWLNPLLQQGSLKKVIL